MKLSEYIAKLLELQAVDPTSDPRVIHCFGSGVYRTATKAEFQVVQKSHLDTNFITDVYDDYDIEPTASPENFVKVVKL